MTQIIFNKSQQPQPQPLPATQPQQHMPTQSNINGTTSQPLVEKKKKASLIFDGFNPATKPKLPEEAPAAKPPPEPAAAPTISKPKPGQKISIERKSNKFTFDKLVEIWGRLEADSHFTIRSKGYLILKNYVLETGSDKTTQPRRNRSRKDQNMPDRSFSTAELVELDKNRFTSTQLVKNIGQWDETSDDAFKMSVNQTLNRLTAKNMDHSLKEIKGLVSVVSKSEPLAGKKNMTLAERANFVTKTLVSKATKEQSFSDLYAQFTSKHDDKDFQEKIVTMNISTFSDSILNPGSEDDEEASLICNGSAKFFSSLAKFKLINEQQLSEIIEELSQKLFCSENNENNNNNNNNDNNNDNNNNNGSKNKGHLHPYHIEMLHSFYLNAGPNVAQMIEDLVPSLWDSVDQCMQEPTLKKRFYFLLVDVKEKRDKWVKKIKVQERVLSEKKGNQPSSDHMNSVRGAFSSFLEDYSVPDIDLMSRDFFYAAMDIFPDQTKRFFDFCEFICASLSKMRAQQKDNTTVLRNRVTKFRDMMIERECPNIWANVSTLINMLLLRKLLSLEKAKEIHENFPDSMWDFANSMKWYLQDFHDFREAIQLQSQWPQEITDALMMPQAIDNLPPQIQMSRLICVALIRSIGQRLKNESKVDLHSLSKWKKHLAHAASHQKNAFYEEMDFLLKETELPKTADQVIEFCSR